MRRAILQPAGSAVAREHYEHTILTPVDLRDQQELLGRNFAVLARLHPSSTALMWGATPGKNDANVSNYSKMSAGDYVLFAGQGRLFAGATVTYTFRNPALAEHLWGRDDKHQTWELMFSLDELRDFDIPYHELNRAIGYQDNNVVQGFTVLDDDRSAALFEFLSLDSDRHPAAPDPLDLADLIAQLPATTEAAVTTLRRLEQGVLRRVLLPGAEGVCALCGEELPVEFLIAAHIKKRSQCSESERLDIPAIAMSACKFGCDAMYEEGYVCVDGQGRLQVSPLAPTAGAAGSYLKRLQGRSCTAFNPSRKEYFTWHREHTFKG